MDPIQDRLNSRNQMVARLAAIHRRAERLMEGLDMVRTTQIIQGTILVGLEHHAAEANEQLDQCLALLERLDGMLVENGVIPPVSTTPLDPEG